MIARFLLSRVVAGLGMVLLGASSAAWAQTPAAEDPAVVKKRAETTATIKGTRAAVTPATSKTSEAAQLPPAAVADQPPATAPVSNAAVQQPDRQSRIAAMAVVQDAKQAQSGGRYAEAVGKYEAALRAPESADPAAKTTVSLAYAQTMEKWAQETSDPSRAVKAEQLYKDSIATGTAQQQQLARNNLGSLQLQQGKYGEALATFKAIDPGADPGKAFAYRYNLGRALELNGNPADAFEAYLGVIEQQPAFVPAREAAVTLLRSQPEPRAKGATRLGTLLLSKGQAEAASAVARALLLEASGQDVAPLLALLIRGYLAQAMDVARFQKTESGFLEGLERRGAARGLAREVQRAMLDRELGPLSSADERGVPFPAWDAQRRAEAFSAWLKHTGDLYAREENHRQALARYLLAWSFDEGNGEAAVYAAMTIRDHRDLDENGRVLTALIDGIFSAKGGYIRSKDWPNSLRTHMVLGSIFEQLGQWGPVSDPRSAAFQWKAALEDERRILETDRSFGRSPGLYAKLGEAYARLGLVDAARTQFAQAAAAFDERGLDGDARMMRDRARLMEANVR